MFDGEYNIGIRDELIRRIKAAGLPCYIKTRFCDEARAHNCQGCESAEGCKLLIRTIEAFVRAQSEIVHMGPQFSDYVNRRAQEEIETLIQMCVADYTHPIDIKNLGG